MIAARKRPQVAGRAIDEPDDDLRRADAFHEAAGGYRQLVARERAEGVFAHDAGGTVGTQQPGARHRTAGRLDRPAVVGSHEGEGPRRDVHGATGDRAGEELGIERAAGKDVEVVGRQRETCPPSVRLEHCFANRVAAGARAQRRISQRSQRMKRHAAAAGFLARVAAIDERDACAPLRQLAGRDAAGRSGADDHRIEAHHGLQYPAAVDGAARQRTATVNHLMHAIILGIFDHPAAAASAARALRASGIARDQISVVTRNHDEEGALAEQMDATPGRRGRRIASGRPAR